VSLVATRSSVHTEGGFKSFLESLLVNTGRVAVVGPTAAGKSEFAMEIARMASRRGSPPFEIVSVDSMAVYRGMDIGTAKPSARDRMEVPHHMIDVVDPWEEYSVSLFKSQADHAMEEIESKGHRVLMVGGTGLYLRALVDGLEIPGRYPQLRAQLEAQCAELGPETLHRRLSELDPVSATRMEPSNARRIVRALEVTLGCGRPFSSFGPGLGHYPASTVTMVGVDAEDLDQRIAARVRRQIGEGLLDEVRHLAERGLSPTARQALGYREMLAHLEGRTSLEEAVAETVRRSRLFARRQRRWFRRDPRIRWIT
jgi:tRNA dimethylallyltransferase